MLRPDPDVAILDDVEACIPAQETNLEHGKLKGALHEEEVVLGEREYVKLSNQFVVPVVQNEAVSSMVVIALSLEVHSGQKETIFLREPKLRDAYLQVLFDHANLGGFKGEFTNSGNLDVLRSALLEVSHDAVGELITDVLIVDIARQDF